MTLLTPRRAIFAFGICYAALFFKPGSINLIFQNRDYLVDALSCSGVCGFDLTRLRELILVFGELTEADNIDKSSFK